MSVSVLGASFISFHLTVKADYKCFQFPALTPYTTENQILQNKLSYKYQSVTVLVC